MLERRAPARLLVVPDPDQHEGAVGLHLLKVARVAHVEHVEVAPDVHNLVVVRPLRSAWAAFKTVLRWSS